MALIILTKFKIAFSFLLIGCINRFFVTFALQFILLLQKWRKHLEACWCFTFATMVSRHWNTHPFVYSCLICTWAPSSQNWFVDHLISFLISSSSTLQNFDVCAYMLRLTGLWVYWKMSVIAALFKIEIEIWNRKTIKSVHCDFYSSSYISYKINLSRYFHFSDGRLEKHNLLSSIYAC